MIMTFIDIVLVFLAGASFITMVVAITERMVVYAVSSLLLGILCLWAVFVI